MLNIIFLFFIGSEGREQRILSYHRKNSIQHGSHYFSSKVFLRLFLSFSAVILIFVVAYSTWYITAYQRRFAETMNRSARQETDAWATYMDRQLFTAQSLCASVNSSENLRSIFQTSYLENKTIDSMQLYRLLREFKRIRASVSNMNITNLFLCFQKDHKIFMPGGVTDIIGTPQMLQQEPELRLTSVAQLLGVSCVPYFISTVVVVGMMTNFLSPSSGIVNQFITRLGGKPTNFMSNPSWFRPLYVISGSWQSFGFNSIIFVAAIMGIDPALYEAMKMDGASRGQQIRHLILPMISDTVILLLIMTLGNLLNVGFEKVYLMYSPAVYETGDVIATYVYRQGIESKNFGYASAVGLFYSAVGFIFVMASNTLARKVTGSSLW